MRIAIIGAGWYGCHLSCTLAALGLDVTVYEQHTRLLHEASGNNQFRLHQGFHYPRHHGTRMQSRDGFTRFVERYPDLSIARPHNIYAISEHESSMDFHTYRLIMTATGTEFTELTQAPVSLQHVSGMLATQERVLMLARTREYFFSKLSNRLRLGQRIDHIDTIANYVTIDGDLYDYVIDATWGHLTAPANQVFYEPTVLLSYEGPPEFPALTFVDGPLCSVYPTEDAQIFTLSSVVHTPLGRFLTSSEARQRLCEVDRDLISVKRVKMEEQISYYYPDFGACFRFIGPQLAIKTKPIGNYDDRSCSVSRNGRIFSVMSGKIDTIFTAAERVLSLLQMTTESTIVVPQIRDDIVEGMR